jgi:hypothetical protein
LLAIASPAGRTASLNVAEVVVRLATEIDETTASFAEGTVYRVVSVVADGFTCPSTFFAIIYILCLGTHQHKY